MEICKRIRDKLDGLDPDPSNQSSISEQVIINISFSSHLWSANILF